MALFGNSYTEDFLLFVRNFKITLVASRTLGMDVKVQYLRTLVHGEVLRQFGSPSADVEGKNPLTVGSIILGLAVYFSLLIRY